MIVPPLILGVLTWGGSQVSDLKSELREGNATVLGKIHVVENNLLALRCDMDEQREADKSLALRNSRDHHRSGMTPCTGCHGR
jgi:hypothetical protein